MSQNNWPEPTSEEYVIKDFHFRDGNTLPELRIHYRTLGRLRWDQNGVATNAVLILHGTTGSGADFFRNIFACRLFNSGQPLSAEDYFLILPDNIGHGKSSKPSDGLRARFPIYCYSDMVRAQHMLLTQHLNVNHVRLVMGTSMGGMHTWIWATTYPDFMDALFPLASLPTQISGRNRMWRKMILDSIRKDPEFAEGNYQSPPRGFRTALYLMTHMAPSPAVLQKAGPDRESADEFLDKTIETGLNEKDANDFAYAFDASWDYDPKPKLGEIKAPLTAVNFADDPICPPELRLLEDGMEQVRNGKAVVVPIGESTIGHGTHSVAEVWIEHLVELLERSKRASKAKL